MTNHPAAEAIASEVRAQLAKQRKSTGQLAQILGITPHTAGRRLNGGSDFSIVELLQIAAWLDVPLEVFISAATAQAAS